jgi:long-subunit fatty acid transport protein
MGNIVVPVDGRQTTIGEMKIRPLMGGVSYSIGAGRLRTSFSLVGGYAFASAKVTTALPAGTAATIEVTDAWVVRPNVGVTYALMKRLALVASVGYVYTNPTIIISVSQQGQPLGRLSGTFRSDYVSITAGTAVSIF